VSGGYFETSWGWIALALLWAAGLALVLAGTASLTRAEVTMLLAFGGLFAWTLASTAGAASADESVREAERLLVYVAAVLAAPLLLRRGREAPVLASLLLGVTAVAAYALGTRLFPDYGPGAAGLEGYRLAEPLGYWNALGIFCALGILLALGFVANARSAVGRALAAVSLVVLSPALYFTYSRGAWAALALGLLAMLAVDPRRLRLAAAAIVVAPAPVAAVWIASAAPGLTQLGSTLEDAAADGRRLAFTLLVLAPAAAALATGFGVLQGRITLPLRARRVGALALTAAGVIALLAVFNTYGGPVAIVDRAYDQFRAAPPSGSGDLNARLFNLSSPGRYYQWQVAWRMVEEHPVLGAGAGTYERYWHQDRPYAFKVRDAHNLYLEMFAELGPVGLGLLLLALGVPAAVAIKARRRPLIAAALGAYVAFLVHAGVDWDWEMPAVTLTALLCGSAILAAARRDAAPLTPRVRGGLLLLLVPLIAFALVGLVGNSALEASRQATDRPTAEAEARKVMRWAPWSANAIEQLGEVQFGYGDLAAARQSFRRAIAKNPEDWNLWFDLALASHGKPLREAVAQATGLNPRDPELAALRRALELQDEIAATRAAGTEDAP
jgi:O-antigen ligase